MKIKLENNFDQWAKMMPGIRKDIEKAVKDKIFNATRSVSRQAKSAAPRDRINVTRQRTGGMLQASIHTKHEKLSGSVVVGADYGPYVEYGTGSQVNVPEELKEYAMQFKGRGIRNTSQRPQPYLYPFFFIQRDKLPKEIANVMDQVFKKHAR